MDIWVCYASLLRYFYWAVAFLSAALLFIVQPALAKALLPLFGGSAAVWTTAMFFFQATLLLGYAWAFWVARMSQRRARIVHGAGLLASLATLPVTLLPALTGSLGSPPLGRLLLILIAAAGAPALLLSATSPLLQSWYRLRFSEAVPWRVFAVSNAASLAGLLAYPFLLEPRVGVRTQLLLWSLGYAIFAILCSALGFSSTFRREAPQDRARESPPSRPAVMVWIGLAATPAALWMAIANFISQTVAPLPLLWVVFLSIYLLSWVLCFSPLSPYRPRVFRWLLPATIVALAFGMRENAWGFRLVGVLALFCGALLVACVFCHGELYRRRPGAAQLTGFYLSIAFGGVLGAAFVGILSPLVFPNPVELPIATGSLALFGLSLLFHASSRRLLRTGLIAAAALLAANAFEQRAVLSVRNFYGALQVREIGAGASRGLALYNGSILHGVQLLDHARRMEPTGYYGVDSAVGLVLNSVTKPNRRVGIIGLGAGTLAAYGRPGDVFRFYEINPLVIDVARRYFTFLKESPAHIDVVEGDARLQLAAESPRNFDVLVVDAFSGDAVPVHLLTREAFELYERHLAPGGALAVHVTNSYLNLPPLVIRTAHALGYRAQTIASPADESRQVSAALWVIVRGSAPPAPQAHVWTDDHSDLLSVLR